MPLSENFRKFSKRGYVDCGYSRLSIAVIERSETELRNLIERGHDVEGESRNKYSPLSLAIGWTAGIKILLDGGADPLRATFNAIGRGDEASVELLLPKCPLFPIQTHSLHLRERSILSYALWVHSPQTIIRLIVKELAKDHQELTNLALQNLSHHQLRSFGPTLKNGNISWLQGKEHQVITALSERGVDIPAKILPCSYTSVYHDTCMSVYAADELWACGLCAIDLPNPLGCTPLLFACTEPNKMISWLINRGARAMDFPQLGIKSYLHVAAVALQGTYSIVDHKYDLSSLNQACSQTLTDSCICYCSSDGCSPVNYLLKKWQDFQVWDWERKSRTLCEWLDSNDIDSGEQETCSLEACRLEIFERLGMAHTCCHFEYKLVDWPLEAVCVMIPMPEDEQSELQDEDRCAGLVQTLEAYMRLYKTLRMKYPGPIPIFWKAWWSTLTGLLPPRGPEVRCDGNCADSRQAMGERVKADEGNETENETSDGNSPDSGPGTGRDLPRGEDIDVQDESDYQVPDDVRGHCVLNENEIRSRMEFLHAGEGPALMGDVFSRDKTRDSNSQSDTGCPCAECHDGIRLS